MENFKWDDATVKEFFHFTTTRQPKSEHWLSDDIAAFKESKVPKWEIVDNTSWMEKRKIIHSVRRKSNGELFKVGDKCAVSFDGGKGFEDIIHHFCSENSGDSPGIIDVYFNNHMAAYDIQSLNIMKTGRWPLFLTEDCKDIYEGDSCWYVDKDFSITYWIDCRKPPRDGLRCFSTEDAAKEYALTNKPCLSIKEVSENVYSISGVSMDNLKTLAKKKINP